MTEPRWSRWPGIYRSWPATVFMWAYALALVIGLFAIRSVSDHPWDTVLYVAAVVGWAVCGRALARDQTNRRAP